MINIPKLQPFKRFCITIGAIPATYIESLSYYETLLWLCKYLQDTVIPAVNTNAAAVTELQTAFETLQSYVDSYFDNLDVQEEINNKLDDMVEAGTLQDIITAYLQVSGVLAYDTVNDMVNASNLINGSFTKTYGKLSVNDTKGAFYKIRTVTNDDVVDGENIIAMETSNTLVAEKMQDPYITIFVGDSYGVNLSQHDGWVQKYVDSYGLTLDYDAINICVGNSGFSDPNGGDNTYLNNLQTYTADIDKSKVTKIIVAGGYNDRTKSATQIEELVSTFMSYVKNNFPNAKVYVGMIANDGNIDPFHGTSVNYREWIAIQVLNGYKSAEKYGAHYLNGVELVMHNYYLFDSYDYVHPNENGVVELAKAIHQAENGSYNLVSTTMYDGIGLRTAGGDGYTKSSDVNTINVNIIGYKYSGIFNIKTTGSLTFTNYQLMNATDTSINVTIGTYTGELKYFRYTNYLSEIPVRMLLTLYNSADICYVTGKLVFNKDGNIVLTINNDKVGTRYISGVSFLGSSYSLPLLAQ